jgi:hypothetical protein
MGLIIFGIGLLLNYNIIYDSEFRENIDATNYSPNQKLEMLEQNFIDFNYVDPSFSAIESPFNLAQREASIITFNQVCAHISILFFISALSVFFIKKVKN